MLNIQMLSPILPDGRKQNLSHFLLSLVISGLSVSHSKFPFLFFLFNLVPNFQGTYTEEREARRSCLACGCPGTTPRSVRTSSASPVLCSCVHPHCCFLRISCYSMVYINIKQPKLRSDFWWFVLSVIFSPFLKAAGKF